MNKSATNRFNFRSTRLVSQDSKLISFYSYLTALSFCDLFSCVFAIVNVLEYVLPYYFGYDSSTHVLVGQLLQIYTHPIATTLQALSCWLICALSVHRCHSILLSINCAQLFDAKPIRIVYAMLLRILNVKPDVQRKSIYEMSIEDMPARGAWWTTLRKLRKARCVIILLYVLSIIYLIPQWFEKRIVFVDVYTKTYIFTEMTQFGLSKIYRQIFHLWFYLIAIYLLPFFLILISNGILLKTFVESKRKCQQYKLRIDAKDILRQRTTSLGESSVSGCKPVMLSQKFTVLKSNIQSTSDLSDRMSLVSDLSIEINIAKSVKESGHHRVTVKSKSKALTLTLFGVVAIFFICHLPAAITKAIYVLYPKAEFENSVASLFVDFSNFLIMFNSSVNFLLYIVFGPARFRRDISTLFLAVFRCCIKSQDNSIKA